MRLPRMCWILRLSIHTATCSTREQKQILKWVREGGEGRRMLYSKLSQGQGWAVAQAEIKQVSLCKLFVFLQQIHLATYSVLPQSVLSFFLPFWNQGNKQHCYWLSYQFPRASINKNNHTLGGSKQKKCIFSQHWRPEVQTQGVGRTLFNLKDLGRVCSLPLPVSGDPSIPWLVATSP